MTILWMLIIGFLVGAVARFVLPGKQPGGVLTTTAAGVFGSIVGGFLLRLTGTSLPSDDPSGLIASVLGAILVLAGVQALTRP